MNVLLGVDTLTYHCRLEAEDTSLEEVMEEVAQLGGDFVQMNAHHLRRRSAAEIEDLAGHARGLRLGLTLSGDVVGRAARGDTVQEGTARVSAWLELARRLGSPFARVSSGFYRNEMLGDIQRIRAEQSYVIDALRLATGATTDTTKVLLENHSDFTPNEYIEIVRSVGSDRVGVFLDLINPVSLLLDPLPTIEQLASLAVAGHAKDYRIRSNYVEDKFFRHGFEVQWCYPGEGLADLPALVGALGHARTAAPYFLSIEGLDNHPGVADQRERLSASLSLLRGLVESSFGSTGS